MRHREIAKIVWLVLLAAAVGLPTGPDCKADDWPFVQGPTFNGHTAESLFENWPDDGPGVLWHRKLGQGYSAIVAADERCVTQYQTAAGQFVICLDVASGEMIWEHRYDWPYEAFGIYPGPRSTPTISGEHVYYATPAGVIACLRMFDGEEVWSVSLVDDLEVQGVGFGYSASPLVLDGLVIVPAGGDGQGVVALHAENGELAWGAGDVPASYCPVLPITLDSQRLLVAYLRNDIMILDMQGTVLWSQHLSIGYDEHASIPVYEEPILVFSAPFRAGATAFRLSWDDGADRIENDGRDGSDAEQISNGDADADLQSGDSGDAIEVTEAPVNPGSRTLRVSQAWFQERFSNDVVSSVAADGVLLGFDLRDQQSKAHRPSRGKFRALDMVSGDILWETDEIGQCGIIAGGTRALIFNDDGSLQLAEFNQSDVSIIGTADVFPDEVCWTRPTLANGRLYLRTQRELICLHVGDITTPNQEPLIAQVTTRKLEELDRSGPSWSWFNLVNGEREHPFMRPELSEFSVWFRDGLLFVMLPGIMLGCLSQIPRRRRGGTLLALASLTFVAAALISTPWLNGTREDFTFTWPAGIFGALQLTGVAGVWSQADPKSRRRHLVARGVGLAFLALCGGYYYALLTLSLPLEWTFLVGCLPALPVAWFTAKYALAQRSGILAPIIVTALGAMVGYGTLFWSAVLFQTVRYA